MRSIQIVGLLVLIVLAASILPLAHAAPTLQTDQPLYTLRDRQVGLSGSGFGGANYYLWLKTANQNSTKYTGSSFSPVSGGLIPPSVTLPINADEPLGVYLVSVSSSSTVDNQVALAHFGLWGPVEPLYQRTQSMTVMGGGLYPGTGFKLSIRDPAGDYVDTATIATDSEGNFNHTWRIPGDAVTETYKILIDGTGTYDNAQQDYIAESRFTVTQAALSIKIDTPPASSYQRSETATITISFQYPDGSPVLKILPNIHPVLLLRNQSTVGNVTVTLTDAANGMWTAQSQIPLNASTSQRYRFEVPALAFDDGFGNKGGPTDTYSDYFQVQNASLVFASQVNGTQIQVPFGQVSIISKITYPDGVNFVNGTADVDFFTGSSTSKVPLLYDPSIGAWRGTYSSSLFDIMRIGVWRLQVEAMDPYGNSGTETYEVNAQPYLFVALITVIIVVALVGRWSVSRYGRKLYFKLRKAIIRFRGHSV